LRSYPPTRGTTDLYHSVKIWEAGRATTAASTFFEPIAVGSVGQEFLDGGTGANNPVHQLWNEAADTYCEGSRTRLLQNVRTVVSIGTGIPDLKDFGDDPLTVGKTLLEMSTETQTTANEFHRNNSDLDDDGRYYRFNVGRGLAGIGLEEANEAKRIKDLTDAYLVEQSTYSSIKKCARTLGDSIVSTAPETLQSTFT
jgi:predicted acylesterase/phospholipase RssA